jgi:DNA-binding MarR family transcriptional regulator
MTESPIHEAEVYSFVLDQIETVPHLEALLLLWNSRPQPWTVENLAKRLYVSTDIVDVLLEDLVRRGLIVWVPGTPDGYRYESSTIAQDQLLSTLDLTYRRETVRISTMIHSKPSSSVREFARAFRFTRERK